MYVCARREKVRENLHDFLWLINHWNWVLNLKHSVDFLYIFSMAAAAVFRFIMRNKIHMKWISYQKNVWCMKEGDRDGAKRKKSLLKHILRDSRARSCLCVWEQVRAKQMINWKYFDWCKQKMLHFRANTHSHVRTRAWTYSLLLTAYRSKILKLNT